jgi:hypothetical protein
MVHPNDELFYPRRIQIINDAKTIENKIIKKSKKDR